MIAGYVLPVTQIQIEIAFGKPSGQEITPLRAEPRVNRIGRRREIVALDAGEDVERERLAVAVPIIDQARTDQCVRVHLIVFQTHSEIALFGNGATGAHPEVRTD